MEGWLAKHKLNKAMLVFYQRTWYCIGKSLHMQTMPCQPFPFHMGKANVPEVTAEAHCFSWLSSGGSCGGTSCWILGCPCFWLETLHSTVETVEAWRRKCSQ